MGEHGSEVTRHTPRPNSGRLWPSKWQNLHPIRDRDSYICYSRGLLLVIAQEDALPTVLLETPDPGIVYDRRSASSLMNRGQDGG